MSDFKFLPKEAYTSEAWFQEEKKQIFNKTWQFAGFIEDVDQPGDYISVQLGDYNLIVIKGKDQRLRAFHNLCRHRGTQLLRSVGKNQKVLTCPYHDWTYNLNGELISVPEQDTEFKELQKEHMHLHRASVQQWRGMIFVHPDKEAPSIMDWFGAIEAKLGPHRPWELVEYKGTVVDEVVEANWKIIVENYIDVYHLSHLHSGTLAMYDHANAEFGFEGPHYWFQEPLEKEYHKNVETLSPYPLIDHMHISKLKAYVPWLFPSLGLSETESAWSAFHVIPLSPTKTRVVVRSKTMNVSSWQYTKQAQKSASSKYWSKNLKAKYEGDAEDPMASGDFMKEDIFACEQQQKAFSNPLFEVGASAHRGEMPIRKFQQIIANYINK
jgi:Rieske 2Fe-2S family protein